MSRREAVVVVAAGRGERLGAAAGGPKALVEIAGRPLLALALERLRDASVDELVVVHTPGHADAFTAVCAPYGVGRLVAGGATRTASVRAGVAAVHREADVVAIHDAARALTPPRVIRSVLDAIAGDIVAAAPAVAVPDTLKRVEGDRVIATVDRSAIRAVHTPQAFVPALLRGVLATSDEATDELALVERALADGRAAGEVRLVAGSPWDLKITYPDDLAVAAALLDAVVPS